MNALPNVLPCPTLVLLDHLFNYNVVYPFVHLVHRGPKRPIVLKVDFFLSAVDFRLVFVSKFMVDSVVKVKVIILLVVSVHDSSLRTPLYSAPVRHELCYHHFFVPLWQLVLFLNTVERRKY